MTEVRKIPVWIQISGASRPGRSGASTAAVDDALAGRTPYAEPVDPGPHPSYAPLLAAARATNDALAAVVEHHAPEWKGYGTSYRCTGCDMGDYAGDSAEWPCSTAHLLGGWLGIEVPQWWEARS